METANDSGLRHVAITTALNEEIDRQAHAGANRIDVDALAQAVEEVIEPDPAPTGPADEGKRPSELNSTNDD
jgi:hypothetical protein